MSLKIFVICEATSGLLAGLLVPLGVPFGEAMVTSLLCGVLGRTIVSFLQESKNRNQHDSYNRENYESFYRFAKSQMSVLEKSFFTVSLKRDT
jgi:hypothetical protein